MIPTQIQSLRIMVLELKAENAELRAWKASALKVMSENDDWLDKICKLVVDYDVRYLGRNTLESTLDALKRLMKKE